MADTQTDLENYIEAFQWKPVINCPFPRAECTCKRSWGHNHQILFALMQQLSASRDEAKQLQHKCEKCGNQSLEEIGHETGGPQGWVVDEIGGCPACLLSRINDLEEKLEATQHAVPHSLEELEREIEERISEIPHGKRFARYTARALMPAIRTFVAAERLEEAKWWHCPDAHRLVQPRDCLGCQHIAELERQAGGSHV